MNTISRELLEQSRLNIQGTTTSPDPSPDYTLEVKSHRSRSHGGIHIDAVVCKSIF